MIRAKSTCPHTVTVIPHKLAAKLQMLPFSGHQRWGIILKLPMGRHPPPSRAVQEDKAATHGTWCLGRGGVVSVGHRCSNSFSLWVSSVLMLVLMALRNNKAVNNFVGGEDDRPPSLLESPCFAPAML